MNQLEIRVLSEGDAQAFWQLQLRARQEEPELFGTAYEELVGVPMTAVTKQLQYSDDSFVIGAFMPHLVGITGFHRQHGFKLCHKGKIWGTYVVPEARNNGVARAMVLAAISRAATISGLEELLLNLVTTNEAARRLYLSVGFESYGIERKALKHASGYTDDDLMALTLAPGGNKIAD